MRWSNGKLIYTDARIFNVTTTLTEESIISDKYLDKRNEEIGAMTIKCSKDCDITLIWKDANKNKEKQYPKHLNANVIYNFEDLENFNDVIYEGEIGTIFNIALSI
ncbi:hypothetical protein P5E90_12475 [Clostridium perfringens]|nr:hypothetical protein [Clostridium perfringens]